MAMTQGQIEYLLHLTDEKIAELKVERENAITQIEAKIAKLTGKETRKDLLQRKTEHIIKRQKEVFKEALTTLQETKERLGRSLETVTGSI